jgi:D-alanyl-lipoteichoic acid acyltransferase DltB (MBOAT superfamily)
MLFNSHVFVFIFLPVVLAGFFALGRFNARAAAAWLFLASVFFYAWWNPANLALLLGSMLFNYAAGVELARTQRGRAYRKRILAAAIAVNLALLASFKYSGFIFEILAPLVSLDAPELALPLGISFFTFTQIAFLVDVYRYEARDYDPVHYGLFVTYFPHLIAGPILHHREMMPQFARPQIYRPNTVDIASGLTVFAIGLFKKVVIADWLVAPHANAVFGAVAQGGSLPIIESWVGATAFGLQIYFDFSGYSDMAIGLSLLFGIRLPVNFNSPYKAESIIEFWRRWHMTLSRFLRDYLYFPLGGNRDGRLARYRNLCVTMLIGGLWHGAGWHFVAWGGLHGIYLVVNHVVRERRDASAALCAGTGRRWANWLLTFAAVTFAWVFFRADSFDSAQILCEGMFGLHGLAWPVQLWPQMGTRTDDYHAGLAALLLLAALVVFVRVAPNTQQIMARFDVVLMGRQMAGSSRHWYHWRLSLLSSLLTAVLFAASIARFNNVTPFLYFQF